MDILNTGVPRTLCYNFSRSEKMNRDAFINKNYKKSACIIFFYRVHRIGKKGFDEPRQKSATQRQRNSKTHSLRIRSHMVLKIFIPNWHSRLMLSLIIIHFIHCTWLQKDRESGFPLFHRSLIKTSNLWSGNSHHRSA